MLFMRLFIVLLHRDNKTVITSHALQALTAVLDRCLSECLTDQRRVTAKQVTEQLKCIDVTLKVIISKKGDQYVFVCPMSGLVSKCTALRCLFMPDSIAVVLCPL